MCHFPLVPQHFGSQLVGGQALHAVLVQHKGKILRVVHGHTHRQLSYEYDGLNILSCPPASYQFIQNPSAPGTSPQDFHLVEGDGRNSVIVFDVDEGNPFQTFSMERI